jgi:hypothetical protein
MGETAWKLPEWPRPLAPEASVLQLCAPSLRNKSTQNILPSSKVASTRCGLSLPLVPLCKSQAGHGSRVLSSGMRTASTPDCLALHKSDIRVDGHAVMRQRALVDALADGCSDGLRRGWTDEERTTSVTLQDSYMRDKAIQIAFLLITKLLRTIAKFIQRIFSPLRQFESQPLLLRQQIRYLQSSQDVLAW